MIDIEKLKQDIEKCRKLTQKGWDSYDAEPILEETVELALKMVDRLPEGYDWVVGPTPDGEIQFETLEGEFVCISCYADSDIFDHIT